MLAIIPARGGSKGLPGKNILLMDGKPLIFYSIQAALNSKCISKVIVSTDDQEIYDLSIKLGASPSFLRPKYLATDDAKAIDNYIYTIDRLKDEMKTNFNAFVVLQPTSPLRTSDDIDCAVELFRDKSADSVISYTEESHPILWHKYLNPDQTLVPIFEETLENRQKHRKSYYPNGAIYIFNVDLLKSGTYVSNRTFAYLMPRGRSVDIDTIEDFKYAEYLLRESNEKRFSS
jgi:CMP-N,N'-diacetyllegionaminic acid synthase